AVARGRDTWSIGLCKELTDPVEQRDCAVAAHYWTRILLRLAATGADKTEILAECEKIPADFVTMHDVCKAMAESPIDNNSSHKVFTDEVPSVGHTNLLFARQDKSFVDVTKKWGVGYGGWTRDAWSGATTAPQHPRSRCAWTICAPRTATRWERASTCALPTAAGRCARSRRAAGINRTTCWWHASGSATGARSPR